MWYGGLNKQQQLGKENQRYLLAPRPVDVVTQIFGGDAAVKPPAVYWDHFQEELELIQDQPVIQ